MLEELKEISFLYDFYGELLPEKQRDLFRFYHEDNLSLSEIAEEFNMTRQGVYEAVRRAEEKLKSYESKLGLLEKFALREEVLHQIDEELQALLAVHRKSPVGQQLEEVSRILQKLTRSME